MMFGIGKFRLINEALGVDIIAEEFKRYKAKKKTDERAYVYPSILSYDNKMFSYGDFLKQEIVFKYTTDELYNSLLSIIGTQNNTFIPHIDFDFSYIAIITNVKKYYLKDLYYKPFIKITLESRFIIDYLYFGLRYGFTYNVTTSGYLEMFFERQIKSLVINVIDPICIIKSDLVGNSYYSFNQLARRYIERIDNNEIFINTASLGVSLTGLVWKGISVESENVYYLGSTSALNVYGTYIKNDETKTLLIKDIGLLTATIGFPITKGYTNLNNIAWITAGDKLTTFDINDISGTAQTVTLPDSNRDFCLINETTAIIFYTSGNLASQQPIIKAEIIGGVLSISSASVTVFRVRSCCKYRDNIALAVHYDSDAGQGYLSAYKDGVRIDFKPLTQYAFGSSVWVDNSDFIYVSDVTNNQVLRTKLDRLNEFTDYEIVSSGYNTPLPYQDPAGYELKKIE